jgi:hypothetical protein
MAMDREMGVVGYDEAGVPWLVWRRPAEQRLDAHRRDNWGVMDSSASRGEEEQEEASLRR